MKIDDYQETPFGSARRTPGTHGYIAYFPNSIPRSFSISEHNYQLLSDAEAALGRLSGSSSLLPSPEILIQPYLRREAVASTRIEGTQASLLDVFNAEANDEPFTPDVEEVINYINAMTHGLHLLHELPMSTRLITEIHAKILAGVRGDSRQPGVLRTSQNWIGTGNDNIETSKFVPPPPEELPALMTDLERYVNEPPAISPLIQAAVMHYQFETIHPFLDGNGRLGRLLIALLLIVRERLTAPLLYLSPYFEEHRDEYIASLQAVRQTGDIGRWLQLFLTGVHTQANDALRRTDELNQLRDSYRTLTRSRTRGIADQVVDYAFAQPVLTASRVQNQFNRSRPSALNTLDELCKLGILQEAPNGKRGQRRWIADAVLQILTLER